MNPMAKDGSNSEGYKPVRVPAALKVVLSGKAAGRTGGKEMNENENVVQIVRLEEKKFVGKAATSPFDRVTGIGEANRFFMERKHELHGAVHAEEYAGLHFSNKVAFTYIYCMEVSDLNAYPDGMIGLTVPGSRYVKARSRTEDPYGVIHRFINENGLERNPDLFAMEIFRFGQEESKYNADIFVPIKD